MEKYEREVDKKIELCKNGGSFVFVVSGFDEAKFKEYAIREMVRRYKKGVFLSLESDVYHAKKYVRELGLTSSLHCVAKACKRKLKSGVTAFDEGLSLNEISHVLHEFMSNRDFNFVIIDNPQAVLRTNPPIVAGKFYNYLVNHFRLMNISNLGICPDVGMTSIFVQNLHGTCDVEYFFNSKNYTKDVKKSRMMFGLFGK